MFPSGMMRSEQWELKLQRKLHLLSWKPDTGERQRRDEEGHSWKADPSLICLCSNTENNSLFMIRFYPPKLHSTLAERVYCMPWTQGDWLHFTKELVLKLHFLSVVGTETEWVYWAGKMREALQSAPGLFALKAVWQSWRDSHAQCEICAAP